MRSSTTYGLRLYYPFRNLTSLVRANRRASEVPDRYFARAVRAWATGQRLPEGLGALEC